MRTKTNELVTLLDITPEQYAVRDDEQHLYHCRIELAQFDPKSGNRLSHPSLQKFNEKEAVQILFGLPLFHSSNFKT